MDGTLASAQTTLRLESRHLVFGHSGYIIDIRLASLFEDEACACDAAYSSVSAARVEALELGFG